MDGSEALVALAEIAIAIAGFSAIVIVLRRSRDPLSPDLLFILRTMIVNSVSVAFLALFPWVLAYTALPEAEVWRWSSGAFTFGVLFSGWPRYIREQRALPQPRDTGVSRLFIVGWGIGGLALIVHFANLFGDGALNRVIQSLDGLVAVPPAPWALVGPW